MSPVIQTEQNAALTLTQDAATAGADDAAADAAVTDARHLISFSLLSKPATSVISKYIQIRGISCRANSYFQNSKKGISIDFEIREFCRIREFSLNFGNSVINFNSIPIDFEFKNPEFCSTEFFPNSAILEIRKCS